MPVVNPGIRRFLGSAIQRLFNSASFYAPLTHTLALERGTGSPTFTRATTATGQKWDSAGYLDFTALAGEAIFTGARRERNFVSAASQDFSNAAWTKLSTTVVVNQAIAPDGTLTADLVHPTSTGADRVVYQNGLVSLVIGSTALLVIRAKYAGIRWLWFGTLGGGTTPAQLPFFDLQNGVAGQAGTYFDAVSMEDLGDGWYECAATKNSLPAAPLFPIYGLGDADGSATVTANGTDGFYLWASQINDITGETDQTTIRPYVSVGVESAPAYHGSMVDGVKCYATDINGSPIPSSTLLGYQAEGARTNYITQSNNLGAWTPLGTPSATQNAVGPNGQANYAWTLTDNDAAGYEGVQTVAAFAAGAAGCFSVLVAKKASSPSYPGIQFYHNTAGGATTAFIINEVAGTMVSFGTVAATAYGCVSYNEDFWLVWCSNTQAGGSLSAALELYAAVSANGSTPSAAGQGSTAFSDAQFEQGTTHPSSRIATTTIAVTRNADVLTYSSAGNIDGTKGWCYAEASTQWSAATGVYNILVGIDTANRGPLLAIDNAPTAIYIADGTNAVQATGASTTFNSTSKRASTWGGSTMSVTGSGAAVASGAFDGNMNVGANISVGILDNGGSAWFGTIRNVRIGQRQLSASELGAITS